MNTAIKEAVEREQYLTFFLVNEECAISILKVREIIEYDTITTVPKMEPWVRGVINLRGSVVPVVELATKSDGTEAGGKDYLHRDRGSAVRGPADNRRTDCGCGEPGDGTGAR